MRTVACQFNDDNAPSRFAGPKLPLIATRSSEYQYPFDLPDAPFPGTLNPGQEALAATMRASWSLRDRSPGGLYHVLDLRRG